MFTSTLILSALAATTSATKLYVSSYAGTITTLDLTRRNETYSLAKLNSDNHCQPNASWLQLDYKNHNLFCLDEGIVVNNGSISSFKVDDKSGNLTFVNRTETLAAPVNSALYTSPNGSQLLAVAQYTSALTTWTVNPKTGTFARLQTFNFTEKPKMGANPDRQAKCHPHQVAIDPTNRFLVVPDLGCDIVRIFHIDPATLQITPMTPIDVAAGSGPRHGQFHAVGNTTFYYLVTEIANTISAYGASYLPKDSGLNLTLINDSKTFGAGNTTNTTMFTGNAASEIQITPNGKNLIVSNRNATYTTIPSSDPRNSTTLKSDSLAHFSIMPNGGVKFGELSPAGGSFPRQFSISPDGTLAAVGLQMSQRLAIYHVCPQTGMLGKEMVAGMEGLGNVTSVVWGK